MNPLESLAQNPKTYALKKFMAQLLEHKYGPHDDIISRMTASLITDADMANFGKLISDIYEVGYMKAVAEYKDQLAKLGIKVTVGQKTLAGNQK